MRLPVTFSCDAVLVSHIWAKHRGECKLVMWFLMHLVFDNVNY